MTFALHHGDAASVLRDKIAERSIDMIYSDPPFGNRQEWKGKRGSFSDTWRESDGTRYGWDALRSLNPDAAALFNALTHHPSDRAYIGMMAGMLIECRRVLKLTGTLWLHFDDTMGAELRILCDAIFGPALSVGTLVWKRSHSHEAKGVGRIHDTIACYARSRAALWRLWRLGTVGGDPVVPEWSPRFDDFAAAPPLSAGDGERIGYPTQKPVALLEELIKAATLRGDTVLDPTCGSGTSLVAAGRMGRLAIGIDASADAIAVTRERLVPKRTDGQTDLFEAA